MTTQGQFNNLHRDPNSKLRVLVQGKKRNKTNIEKRNGPLSYTIKRADGVVTSKHEDHILDRREEHEKEHGIVPESVVQGEQHPEPLTAEREERDAVSEEVAIN